MVSDDDRGLGDDPTEMDFYVAAALCAGCAAGFVADYSVTDGPPTEDPTVYWGEDQ